MSLGLYSFVYRVFYNLIRKLQLQFYHKIYAISMVAVGFRSNGCRIRVLLLSKATEFVSHRNRVFYMELTTVC